MAIWKRPNQWDKLFAKLDSFKTLIELDREILKAIKALQKPTENLGIFWKTGGKNMPATLPLGATVQGWVTLGIDNHDGKGSVPQSVLPAGQSLGIASADEGDFTAALDATPVPAPADGSGNVPPTVGSFVVKASSTPTQPNAPVKLTITIANADGSQAAVPLEDTVTVSEAATEVLGDLFGVPVVPAPPAGS